MPVIYDYEYIKQLLKNPGDTLIIDVREAEEFAEYHLPHAVNMPYTSHPAGLSYDEDKFERIFMFKKPRKSDEIVFHCASGRRSGLVDTYARFLGYTNTGNYAGSINEWVLREGKSSNR